MRFRPGREDGIEHRGERERVQKENDARCSLLQLCVANVSRLRGCVFSLMLLPRCCWHGRLRHQRRHLRRGRPKAYPTLVATNRGPYVL